MPTGDPKSSSSWLERYKALGFWERVFAPIIVIVVSAVLVGVLVTTGDDKATPVTGGNGTAPPKRQCLHITAPPNHAKITRTGGAVLEGTICNDDDVWVFDHDAVAGLYFQVNEEPIPVSGGKWVQKDRPIGDPGDRIGMRYQIVAVRVRPQCSRAIEKIPPDKDQTVATPMLPNGCPNIRSEKFADSVILVKAG